MRIGILADDPALAGQLDEILARVGHKCIHHRCGQKLIRFLGEETVDILLLESNLPDMPGAEVIRRVRRENPRQPPILLLTPGSAEQEIIAALKAGADGYAVIPLQPAVLMARIEAVCRHADHASTEPIRPRTEQFGDFVFDARTETVHVRGEPIQLTAKEFALGLTFFRNVNRTLSRSYLLETFWGRSPNLETRTIDAHISKLRKKLGLHACNSYRLLAIYGRGYRLESIGPETR